MQDFLADRLDGDRKLFSSMSFSRRSKDSDIQSVKPNNMKKVFYRKNKQGRPIPGSNKKLATRPYGSWDVVVNFVNGPVPNEFKPAFPGNMRYFFEMTEAGDVVEGGLVQSTSVPEGNYLELFTNGVATLPLGSNENSGVVEDDPEDVVAVPIEMSESFRQKGYRTKKVGNKTIIITD